MSIEERDTEVKVRPPGGSEGVWSGGGDGGVRSALHFSFNNKETPWIRFMMTGKSGKNNSDKSVSGVSADIISRIYSQTAARLKNKRYAKKTGTDKKKTEANTKKR